MAGSYCLKEGEGIGIFPISQQFEGGEGGEGGEGRLVDKRVSVRLIATLWDEQQ